MQSHRKRLLIIMDSQERIIHKVPIDKLGLRLWQGNTFNDPLGDFIHRKVAKSLCCQDEEGWGKGATPSD